MSVIERGSNSYGALAAQTGTLGDGSALAWDGGRLDFKGLIIGLHGDHLGASMWSQIEAGDGLWYEHVRALIAAAYVFVGIDAGGASAWATSSVVGSGGIVDVARMTVQGEFIFASSKVGLLGYSMGGLTALLYGKFNPTQVAGMELISPATDLKFCYGQAGYTPAYPTDGVVADALFKSEINSAYSCTPSTFLAATAGHRPEEEYNTWNGMCPIRVYGADDDATLPHDSFGAFVAGVNDRTVTYHELATGGHGPIQKISPQDDTVAFFETAAWA